VTAKQDAQFPFRDQPLSVTVSRIIGNDLFPRHRRGQAVANLRTMLQAESNPYGWGKLFVLNRFVDPRLEREAISLIAEAGHACEVLSFQSEAYQALRYRPELFGGLDYFASPQFLAKDPFTQDRERIWACGEKIRYLMNINGARNHALAVGRARSDWTLVLDGSCFLADRTFAALQRDREGNLLKLMYPLLAKKSHSLLFALTHWNLSMKPILTVCAIKQVFFPGLGFLVRGAPGRRLSGIKTCQDGRPTGICTSMHPPLCLG